MLVALVFYLGAIGVQLQRYDGDPTGFVQFGSQAVSVIQPPQGAHIVPDRRLRRAVLLRARALAGGRDHVRMVFEPFEYRAQRIAYPALAWALSGWLALGVALAPGILMTLLRDLTDVVALAAALGALWAWAERGVCPAPCGR